MAEGAHVHFAPPTRVVSRHFDPKWAIEQTHQLCRKNQEEIFQDKARLLDESKHNSIRSAINFLNSPEGKAEVTEAFCIVYSKNKGSYFLVYQRLHQREAFQLFGIHEQWSVKQVVALCKEGEESRFEGRAILLDPDRSLEFADIQEAITMLNYPYDADERIYGIPDICVVWIHGLSEYYVVYREGHEATVRNDLGIALPSQCDDEEQFTASRSSRSERERVPSAFAQSMDTMASKVNKMFRFLVGCDPKEESSKPTRSFDPKLMASSFERKLCSKYEVLEQIGSGAQGTAHLVKKKNTMSDEELFVAKETHDMSEAGVAGFMKEFERMCALRHPNCLRVFELFHCPAKNQLFIITDYAKGGDLYHYMNVMMQHEDVLSEDVVARMMQQAMRGVAYLHAENFVHNDLKPDNLLVMEAYEKGAAPRLVVADYGCATLMSSGTDKIFYGDPRYMSPEAMRAMMAFYEKDIMGEKSGPNVDVWAMGVTIYQFLGKGVLPFLYDKCALQDLKGQFPKLRTALLNSTPVEFKVGSGDSDSTDSGFSKEAQDLIRKLLEKNQQKRCTIAEVLDDPWFANAKCRELSRELSDQIRFHATRDGLRQILRNAVASKLRYNHVEHCFKIFSKFDPDNSGSISKEEFRKAWKAYDSSSSTKMADEYFDRADVDKNESLEFNEFAAITLDWSKLDGDVLDQHLTDLFDIMKEGEREQLDIATFKRLFGGILGTVGEKEMQACIQEIDQDGDGFITVEELKGFVRKDVPDQYDSSRSLSGELGDSTDSSLSNRRLRCSSMHTLGPLLPLELLDAADDSEYSLTLDG